VTLKIHMAHSDKYLVTGSNGFIGFHLSKSLLEDGEFVIGIDNNNDYYDVGLKNARFDLLKKYDNFTFYNQDIASPQIEDLLNGIKPTHIINLAASAGVRHSIDYPHTYIHNNITGFLNILEYSKNNNIKNVVYASTSSVYGGNVEMPLKESHGVNHPLQLYAVTKRTNELMAHAYSNLFGVRTTGLRFFTVYGPWGRPDMALFLFTKNIIEDKPINVFNYGKHVRDFTYVSDIVDGIKKCSQDENNFSVNQLESNLSPDTSPHNFRIFNIGGNNPIELEAYIKEIEINLGKKAIKNYQPLQAGDVEKSISAIDKINSELGYEPKVSIKDGVKSFVDWYLNYYK
jgi:UDP-glucuronate 4-epimerase